MMNHPSGLDGKGLVIMTDPTTINGCVVSSHGFIEGTRAHDQGAVEHAHAPVVPDRRRAWPAGASRRNRCGGRAMGRTGTCYPPGTNPLAEHNVLGMRGTFCRRSQARCADSRFAADEGTPPLPAPGFSDERIQGRMFPDASKTHRTRYQFLEWHGHRGAEHVHRSVEPPIIRRGASRSTRGSASP